MKLAALKVENFGPVGDAPPVEILIDNIVLLVGPNNSGKSTILDAYEAFYAVGDALPPSRFYRLDDNDPLKPVRITGTFTDLTTDDVAKISDKWIHDHPDHLHLRQCVRVMWTWAAPDQKGSKSAFLPKDGAFVDGGVGGFDSIITSCLPVPLRIAPTDSPEAVEAQVREILVETVKAAAKAKDSRIAEITKELQRLTSEFHKEVETDVTEVCSKIGAQVGGVFEGYSFTLAPEIGKFEAEKVLGTSSYLKVTAPHGAGNPLSRQGTGLQRAFLWSALAALAELGRLKYNKKPVPGTRPRILLVDEPEAFLHPPAIRAARDALYNLAAVPGWQVLASTHSPVMVDVSRDHTTIVRIDRTQHTGARHFSTEKAKFDASQRDALRMVRSCHPTTNEFFFADTVLLVEGDTEHAVIDWLAQRDPTKYRGLLVVNCMGKGLLPLFARILNQFQTPYVILHDSDAPSARRRNGSLITNAMWTENAEILTALAERAPSAPSSHAVVHIPDFEGHYFGTSAENDKPFRAITRLKSVDLENDPAFQHLRDLLPSLVNGTHPNRYSDATGFLDLYTSWLKTNNLETDELWRLR